MRVITLRIIKSLVFAVEEGERYLCRCHVHTLTLSRLLLYDQLSNVLCTCRGRRGVFVILLMFAQVREQESLSIHMTSHQAALALDFAVEQGEGCL